MIHRDLLRLYRFFRKHGAGRVGHSAEASLSLARAMLAADARDLVFVEEDETEAWDADCPAPTYLLWCAVYLPDDVDRYGQRKPGHAPLAAVGMVGINERDDPYLGVIRGALALEALDVLTAMDQSEADKLAARATYAGPVQP